MTDFLPKHGNCRRLFLSLAVFIGVIPAAMSKEPAFLIHCHDASRYLYVGQAPTIRLQVSCTGQSEKSVISPNRIFSLRALRLDVIDPDGNLLPDGLPTCHREEGADDYVSLQPGQIMDYCVTGLVRLQRPGKYLLKVWFRPTPKEKDEIAKEYVISCTEIPRENIVRKVWAVLPKNPRQSSVGREVVDFQIVKSTKGCILFYRSVNGHFKSFSQVKLQPLFPVEATTTIVVAPMFYDQGELIQQLWLTYSQGDQLRAARIDYLGALIDNIPLGCGVVADNGFQVQLTNAAMDILWAYLGSDDFTKVEFAKSVFRKNGTRSVRFLMKRVPPVPEFDDVRFRQLLAKLDSASFSTREEAAREMGSVFDIARSEIEQATHSPSLETRRRVRRLVSTLEHPYRVRLARAINGVRILELIGTSEAKAVLQKISLGNAASPITREADHCLQRLGK